MKCCKCGKKDTSGYKLSEIYSLTENSYLCEKCKEDEYNELDELLEAIKNGEDISRFI
jgi:hypothetical protein